ncbi:MAG: ferritin-like domain-containing protein [Minicystis sp.]
MRLSVSLDAWTARLFAVLALSPVVACGSVTPAGTGGAGGGGLKPPCKDPEPVLIDGKPTGYVDCAGNWTHRESITTCPSKLPTTATCQQQGAGGGSGACATDADCTAQPNGHCELVGGPFASCTCTYGCTTDADCGQGRICVCGDPIGTCVHAECQSDADCGNGLCATYTENPGCGGIAYACQSAEDECTSDSTCLGGKMCTWTGSHRVCVSPTCSVGRPFLVAGAPRLAAPAARGDWHAPGSSPRPDHLDPAVRAALAARWTEVGLMEHASIAAFARFALQLLALGAPPDLLRDTQAAMADETRHAEVCFALASAYAGRAVGPGPLAMDRALESIDARSTLITAIHEGCVGETIAAVEAAEMAARAEDPVVRAALSAIAEDETRHAELAFRFVRWAITRTPALAAVARAAFADALGEAPMVSHADTDHEAALIAHGIPGNKLRQEIRRQALQNVVGPCARALLAEEPSHTEVSLTA